MISPIKHSGCLPGQLNGPWLVVVHWLFVWAWGTFMASSFKFGTGGLKMDLQGAAVTLEDIFTVGGLASPEDQNTAPQPAMGCCWWHTRT